MLIQIFRDQKHFTFFFQKLLNKQLALFKLVPLGVYTKKQGFKSLESKKKQPAQAMETDDLET